MMAHKILEAGEMAREYSEKGNFDEAIKSYNKIGELIYELIPELKEPDKKLWINMAIDAKNEIEKIKQLKNEYLKMEKRENENLKKDHSNNAKQTRQEPSTQFVPTNPTLVPFLDDVLAMRRHNINLSWNDIANLDKVKFTLQTTILAPIRYRAIIEAKPIYATSTGALLFGPPGTGKTMLAKAVATEGQTAFFECNPSNLLSKWRGDSLKILECLMEVARYYAPSTVFFDEIDVFCSKRGQRGEAEHSRRLKTEFLTQMDGIKGRNIGVLFLGATNFPWNLDDAILRRLQRRCYIPLPDQNARKKMLYIYLEKYQIGEGERVDFDKIAKKLDGYSGSDIYTYCRTIVRLPVERFLSQRINLNSDEPIPIEVAVAIREEYLADGSDEDSINRKFPLLKVDFEKGFELVYKSVGIQDIKAYEKWDNHFGAYTDERLQYLTEETTTSSDASFKCRRTN